MTPRQDPYRVLGLVPGATAGEIRSAYRRLAKLNHPDTAGDRSLPRFLAIQAAYEELVDDDGRLRIRSWPARGGAGSGRASGSSGSAGGAGSSGSSTAHRASRDGWRARRASQGGDGPGPDSAGTTGSSSGSSGPTGSSGAGDGGGPKAKRGTGTRDRAPGSGRTGKTKGERRTARPGSTTYDEAAMPLDPAWDGGSWYGASSGRYWTLNPREYADPRKHGPEYQERAKKAAEIEARLEAMRRAGSTADGPPPGGDETPDEPATAPPTPRRRSARPDAP